MWLSMTGYGRNEGTAGDLQITVELKATNHRFQEIVLRSPRELAALEERVRKALQERFLRGRMEVSIAYRHNGTGQYRVSVQPDLALAYQKGLEQLAEVTSLPRNISLSELAALPEVLKVERAETDLEAIWILLQQVLQSALADFNTMRLAEGVRLHDDLSQRLEQIKRLCAEIEAQTPRVEHDYQERLRQRLQEVLEGAAEKVEIDQSRLLQEVAVWVERTTVTEELVRLNSHNTQFEELLALSGEAVGRRADFLLQEMNREVNTIGSKANDLKVNQLVIELKAELEKIREQVQNIE